MCKKELAMSNSSDRDQDRGLGSSRSRQVLESLFLLLFIVAVLAPVAYIYITVILPGVAAGLAQFSLLGSHY
jgi:hypothetical protein